MTNEEEMKAQAKALHLIIDVNGYKVSFAGSDEVSLFQMQYAMHAIFNSFVTNAGRFGVDPMDALHAMRNAVDASAKAIMEEWKEEYYAEDHD